MRLRQRLVLLILTLLPVVVIANDEPQALRAVANEIENAQRLVVVSEDVAANNATRVSFDYGYLLEGLDYLKESMVSHADQVEALLTTQWDLNNRQLANDRFVELRPDSYIFPVYSAKSTERENLVAIAKEIELIRLLLIRGAPDGADVSSTLYYDYDYAVEVLRYMEFALRSHMSLQHSLPRIQWDSHRYDQFITSKGAGQ